MAHYITGYDFEFYGDLLIVLRVLINLNRPEEMDNRFFHLVQFPQKKCFTLKPKGLNKI
jgi:hypothetical protein